VVVVVVVVVLVLVLVVVSHYVIVEFPISICNECNYCCLSSLYFCMTRGIVDLVCHCGCGPFKFFCTSSLSSFLLSSRCNS
jgi:hypothetical protein